MFTMLTALSTKRFIEGGKIFLISGSLIGGTIKTIYDINKHYSDLGCISGISYYDCRDYKNTILNKTRDKYKSSFPISVNYQHPPVISNIIIIKNGLINTVISYFYMILSPIWLPISMITIPYAYFNAKYHGIKK